MSLILGYFLAFIASLLVDCIPFFAPPAWMLMMLAMAKFDLHPWITAVIGNLGTTAGRFIYSTYIVPWVGKRALGKNKHEDLRFIGKKLSGRPIPVFIFVFLYALSPLSTTALFTAVGLANVKRSHVLPAFFIGHAIGDGLILTSGKYAINNWHDIFRDSSDPRAFLMIGLGLVITALLLFIDWQKLLTKKKLVLDFTFWK